MTFIRSLIYLLVSARVIGLIALVNPPLRLPPGAQFIVAEPPLPCQFCHHRLPRGHWETGCSHEIACMVRIPAEQVIDAVNRAVTAQTASSI